MSSVLPAASTTMKWGNAFAAGCTSATGVAAAGVTGAAAADASGFDVSVSLPVHACSATPKTTTVHIFKMPIFFFIQREDTHHRREQFIKPR
jgi:hypothetical protein